MQRNKFWRAAALFVLGTTAGALAADFAHRHADSAAAALAGLDTNPVAAVCPAAECCEPIAVAASAHPTRRTRIFQLRNAVAADVLATLQKALADVLDMPKPDVVMVAEPVTNMLIFNFQADQGEEIMTRAAQLITTLDVAQPQVQIEVLIAEVDCLDGTDGLGLFHNGGNACNMPNDKFKALVNDWQQQGRCQVIAAPTIVTTDNQAARILVGQNFPYITGTSATSATTDSPAITTNTVAYRDVGIQVQVTPKISPDGTVTMRIIPEITAAVPTTTQVADGVFGTAFNVQTMETTVMVKDGETAAIGGLSQTREVSQSWFCFPRTQRTEVVVFVTAHVHKQQ